MPARTSIGELIAGRYQVVRLIARGGMGSVFEARQVALDRPVAIKFLNPPISHLESEREAFEKRFNLEAAALARLSNPNIVSVFDYGQTEDGRSFLVMEYIDGPPLGTVLKEESPLDPLRAVRLMVQVCSALRNAHMQEVVHRDLKPNNLLIKRAPGGSEQVNQDLAVDNHTINAQLDWRLPREGFLSLSGGINDGLDEFFALGTTGDYYSDQHATYLRGDAGVGPVRLRTFWNHLDTRSGPWYYQTGTASWGADVLMDIFDVDLAGDWSLGKQKRHRITASGGYRFKDIDWNYLDAPHTEHHFNAFLQDESRLGPVGPPSWSPTPPCSSACPPTPSSSPASATSTSHPSACWRLWPATWNTPRTGGAARSPPTTTASRISSNSARSPSPPIISSSTTRPAAGAWERPPS